MNGERKVILMLQMHTNKLQKSENEFGGYFSFAVLYACKRCILKDFTVFREMSSWTQAQREKKKMQA